MVMTIQKFLLLGFLGFVFAVAFLGKNAGSGADHIEDYAPAPEQLVSIQELLEPEAQEVVFGDQKIVAFMLGLGWEDGYHEHFTEDEELIEQLVTEFRKLQVRVGGEEPDYTCDASEAFYFFTEDGNSVMIPFNSYCMEVRRDDGNDRLYHVENMNDFWKLCLRVYDEGYRMD